jgi:hypothetical protein
MHVKDMYSIIVTDKHAECRDFYVRWLDFDVIDARFARNDWNSLAA